MTRALLVILTFVSAIFFPWPLTALVAILVSTVEPLVPLAAGLFMDALYLPQGLHLPLATFLGALVSLIAFFVRSRLLASII